MKGEISGCTKQKGRGQVNGVILLGGHRQVYAPPCPLPRPCPSGPDQLFVLQLCLSSRALEDVAEKIQFLHAFLQDRRGLFSDQNEILY